MEPFNDYDKAQGLFTFYREQADLEEFLHQKKNIKKYEKVIEISESTHNRLKQKGCMMKAEDSKLDQNNKLDQYKHKSDEDKNFLQKPSEQNDSMSRKKQMSEKIVELLERNKYKRNKHHRMIVVQGTATPFDEKEHAHVNCTHQHHQTKNNYQWHQLCKRDQYNQSELLKKAHPLLDYYLQTKLCQPKPNPFPKLALQPVSFHSQIDSPSNQTEKQTPRHQQCKFINLNSVKNHLLKKQKKILLEKEHIEQIHGVSSSQPLQQKLLPKIYTKRKQNKMQVFNRYDSSFTKRQNQLNNISLSPSHQKIFKIASIAKHLSKAGKELELEGHGAEYNKQKNKKKHSSSNMKKQQLESKIFFQNSQNSKILEESLSKEKQQMYYQVLKKLNFDK